MHSPAGPATFAAGVRLPFADVPAEVRAWVERVLGGTITRVDDKTGGFSPGVAAVVDTDRGARGFVKAVGTSINAEAVRFHRAEIAVMFRLPPDESVVRPVASDSLQVDGEDWEVMILPVIDGVAPVHPWTPADASRVFDALDAFGRRHTPSRWGANPARVEKLAAFFRGWSRLSGDEHDRWQTEPWVKGRLADLITLEAAIAERLAGDTLTHTDLRADNVLLTPDRVWFVDWAHAGNAARWVDPVLLLCDVVASGADRADGGEIDIAAFAAGHPAFDGVEPALIAGVMAALAATLHWLSQQPPPPGLPTLRGFQHAQSEALLRYVARTCPDGIRLDR